VAASSTGWTGVVGGAGNPRRVRRVAMRLRSRSCRVFQRRVVLVKKGVREGGGGGGCVYIQDLVRRVEEKGKRGGMTNLVAEDGRRRGIGHEGSGGGVSPLDGTDHLTELAGEAVDRRRGQAGGLCGYHQRG
jgi:hypothetical protein